jgi:predicted phage tail protein
LNIVIGVVLVAATWYAGGAGGWGWSALQTGGWAYQAGMAIGVSLALSGISQLMSPTPQISSKGYEREAEKPSFVFNGPVNRTEQGGPITLVYGEIITGSIVVGGSIDSEEYV